MSTNSLISIALDFYVLLSFLSIYIAKKKESLTNNVYAFCILIPYLPIFIVPFFNLKNTKISPAIILIHVFILGVVVFLWRVYLPLTDKQ
jgi:hypothetical protein